LRESWKEEQDGKEQHDRSALKQGRDSPEDVLANGIQEDPLECEESNRCEGPAEDNSDSMRKKMIEEIVLFGNQGKKNCAQTARAEQYQHEKDSEGKDSSKEQVTVRDGQR
jgi:hypothetical protein